MKRNISKRMFPIVLSVPIAFSALNVSTIFAEDIENTIEETEEIEIKKIKTAKVSGIVYELTASPTQTTPGDAYVYLNPTIQTISLVIPDQISVDGDKYNVVGIRENAFKENIQLKTVSIGKNISNISSTSFLGCPNLSSYTVDNQNKYFSVKDDILYNANKTEIISCPIGKELETYTIPSSVTKVGSYAFYGNDKLYNVTFNTELLEIGDYSFSKCLSLKTISMGNKITKIGNYAFSNTALTYAKLSNNLSDLGEGAFESTMIKEIKIPQYLNEIKDYTFYNCEYLRNFSLSSSNVTFSKIGNYAFAETGFESFTVPEKVKTIGNNAFYGCLQLKQLNFNNNISSIGSQCFKNCESLSEISIPAALNEIGEDAFLGCIRMSSFYVSANNMSFDSKDGALYKKGFEELLYYPAFRNESIFTLPSTVTAIKENALAFCKNINSFEVEDGNYAYSSENGILYDFNKSVLIQYPIGRGQDNFSVPENVKKISGYAFADSLITGTINIPITVEEIGDYAFYNCKYVSSFSVNSNSRYYATHDDVLFTYDKKTLIQYPINKNQSSYRIPDTVITIHEGAFANTNIIDISAPQNLKSIGDNAFNNTKFLKIELNDSLNSIGNSAFANSSLTSINIPYNVKHIGNSAFNSGKNLRIVNFSNNLPPSNLGNDIFENNSKLEQIIVPANSIPIYKTVLPNFNINDVSILYENV